MTTGFSQIQSKLTHLREEAPVAVLADYEILAGEVLQEAIGLAPRDKSELAESGKVVRTEDGFEVVFDAKHAAYQHERLDLNHPNGGGPKFLEQAYLNALPQAQSQPQRRLDGMIAGG